MNNTGDLVCTLGAPELAHRVGEWSAVAARATSRVLADGRIVSTYPADQVLVRRLRELIAAEAECCSFLEFTITERPDEVIVELAAPDEMSDALAMMLGLVTDGSKAATG